jgi:hypothetical protein
LAALFTAACTPKPAAAPPPSVAAPPSVTRLHFAWPIPSRGVITATMHKGTDNFRSRYEMVAERDPATKNIAVHFQNFSFLEIEGVDLHAPGYQASLRQSLALASAVPTILVSDQGRVVGITDYDAAVTKALAAVADAPEMQANLRQALENPVLAKAMKSQADDNWNEWVSFWLDIDIPASGSAPFKQQVPLLDGTVVDAPANIRRGAPDPAFPNDVVVEVETSPDTVQLTQSLGRLLEKMSKENPPADGATFHADALESAARSSKMRLVTDPKTMRPDFASEETTTTINMKGEPVRKETSLKEYRFDWSRAAPAAAR